MERKKNKRLSTILKTSAVIIGSAFLFLFFGNYFLTVYEQHKYKEPGELIEINGKNMHLQAKGEGENTIVLLSGLGTAAPVLDFEPLANELSKENKVVVVELPGYGWSDKTEERRTVENIVEEIRSALKKAKVEGPYILMPHSISGIYSMYFADQYPEEVKAVIGIDPTLPEVLDYFNETPPEMPQYLKYIAPSGIARMALAIKPGNFLPLAAKKTYTEENLTITKAMSGWNGYNKNVIEETNEIINNINKTKEIDLSADMPVLFFTPKEETVAEDGKSKIAFYETQLTDHPASKVIALSGHHYLHWARYKEMSREANQFMKSFETD